ncbi:MAG: MraY family glycosyltransferase [Verrucomicrobiales bacterium]
MDRADSYRKTHDGEILRLGGLPIFIALVCACALIALRVEGFLREWWPVLLCNALLFGIGFWDDLKPLGARVKLCGQVAVALIGVALGMDVEILISPFTSNAFITISLGSLSVLFTLAWLIAIPNIVNLIDGMDGLASGLGFFLCLTMGIVGYQMMPEKVEVTWISMAMAGALLGFLCFNFPPARIFLGDGGAYLIGFFVASVSLQSSNKGAIAASLLVVIVALGLPILDTAFAIIRRGLRGMPLFRGDAEHIHHRLVSLGFSKNTALITMYAVCALLSLIGLSILWSKGLTLPIAGAAFFILALVGARYLGYVKSWAQFRKQVRIALARRQDTQYAMRHGLLLEMEIDRCAGPEEFWALFEASLRRLGFAETTPEVLQNKRDFRLLSLYVHRQRPWILAYPRSQHDAKNWKTLAECLQPAYTQALMKWGAEGRDLARERTRSRLKSAAEATTPPPFNTPQDAGNTA